MDKIPLVITTCKGAAWEMSRGCRVSKTRFIDANKMIATGPENPLCISHSHAAVKHKSSCEPECTQISVLIWF